MKKQDTEPASIVAVPAFAPVKIGLDEEEIGKLVQSAVADSVIVTGGHSNVAIGELGTVVGRDVVITAHTNKRILSKDQAFERLGAAVRLDLDQLERNIAQPRSESG